MKTISRIIIIIIQIFCWNITLCQNQSKEIDESYWFFEIKIRETPMLLYKTITLNREGLLYFIYPDSIYSENKVTSDGKYINMDLLDSKKVMKIMKYVRENELYKIKNQEIPKGVIKPEANPIVISFLAVNKNEYDYFYYSICDKKIDKLIIMLNDLIPKEDKEKYSIRPRCYD